MGLAIINTMLTQRTDDHYARLSEQVSWSNRAALDWLASVGAITTARPRRYCRGRQETVGNGDPTAWLLSFMDVFMGLTVLFTCLVFMALLLKKPKAVRPPVPDTRLQ